MAMDLTPGREPGNKVMCSTFRDQGVPETSINLTFQAANSPNRSQNGSTSSVSDLVKSMSQGLTQTNGLGHLDESLFNFQMEAQDATPEPEDEQAQEIYVMVSHIHN